MSNVRDLVQLPEEASDDQVFNEVLALIDTRLPGLVRSIRRPKTSTFDARHLPKPICRWLFEEAARTGATLRLKNCPLSEAEFFKIKRPGRSFRLACALGKKRTLRITAPEVAR